jgi:hypothetical protein
MAKPHVSPQDEMMLTAIADGATLKVHRTLDGDKAYRLHPLDGPPSNVSPAAVEGLERRGLLKSNMKFPAATFVLTQKGQQIMAQLRTDRGSPVASRSFTEHDATDS